jgi:hypothetical protein
MPCARSGVPANPPRALAYQLQQRLGLLRRPEVQPLSLGVAVALMGTPQDYAKVVAAGAVVRLFGGVDVCLRDTRSSL